MKYNFNGLTSSEVEVSRTKNGSNELSPAQKENFWNKLLENFKDPIIIILCAALIIVVILSFFDVTEWYEALAIGVAVLLATFVSTYSEFKNESSFQKLQEEASKITTNAFRNGHIVKIPIGEIVVGDIVLLQSGDKIPADGIIVTGEIKVNQASLTGESENARKWKVTKQVNGLPKDPEDPMALFRGTVVEDGEAIMKVASVGDKTLYGELALELSNTEERLSPLQVKLKDLAKLISRIGYMAGIMIAIAFMFNKLLIANHFDVQEIINYIKHWDAFLVDILDATILSIIIIVAAVPEGLPMMIAIVLSLNMSKLLKEKVLVRKLLGIETSGSLNILFTDKTGTITKGQFQPKFFISGSNKEYENYQKIPDVMKELLSFSILENTACVIAPNGDFEGGNISDRALMSFLDKKDIIKKAKSKVEVQKSILFNSARKFSASQVISESVIPGIGKKNLTLIKGAPEVIFEYCATYFSENGNIEPLHSSDLIKKTDELANDGMRMIAVAFSEEKLDNNSSIPEHCCLLGIIGIRDEIREESKKSIQDALKAGVQIVMLTGDRKGTAIAIAKEVGLLKGEGEAVMTSAELSTYSDEELKILLPGLRLVARALPTDKSRLVRIAKSLGKVVGMTGDGVNDSPALKQSDVGFAMGSGSEVSKEASDIVILDDNFNSISNAIRYGRTIFKSIRKFIVFQLTINLAAASITFLGPFFGIDFPLTIIQLLWINIIMDTLAAIAFGGEPALKRFMNEMPVKRTANILSGDMLSSIFLGGMYITVFSLFFLNSDPIKLLFIRGGVPDQKVLMTAFFNLFVFMITLNSFNARTDKINLFEHLYENKNFIRVIVSILVLQVIFTYLGGNILRTTALRFEEWIIIILMSASIIPLDIFRKLIVHRL